MNEQTQSPNTINFLSVTELAKELSIKENTVYSYVSRMKIPSYKLPLATQLYFILDEVRSCLSKTVIKSNLLIINSIERNSMCTKSTATKTMIDVNQLADFLKIRISTVYSWTHKKIIPVYQYPGTKKIYFIQEEIVETILNNRSFTKNELEVQAQTQLMKMKRTA